MKKPYHLYEDLCDKIEQDNRNISDLKEIIKDKDEENKFLKELIKQSDITVNSLIDLLINMNDLTSQQRKYINELISKKIETDESDLINNE